MRTKCLWCHGKLAKYQLEHSTASKPIRFCSQNCSLSYRKIEQRIKSIYYFSECLGKELEALEVLGKDYRFKKPHEDLNHFYGLNGFLKGDKNAEA